MPRATITSPMCHSTCRGSARRGSAPRRPRATRPASGSRSSAPPSALPSTPPTRTRSPRQRTRGCRAATRAMPTACSRWPGCAVGLALVLPLFNRNGGEIGQARAARDRAQANLDVTRRESAADVARARRSFSAARARLERDRRLLASADRVAAMSLQAYAEGAVPLANVLEAQRNAREALGRYIDDVAAANDAAGVVRLVTASARGS